MRSKIIKWLVFLVPLCGLIVGGLTGYGWYLKKQILAGDLVAWQGHIYTREEMEKMFPQYAPDVPAKNTPEEVYEKFREAVLNDDEEAALDLISAEKKEEYKKEFSDKKMFDNFKNLPEVEKIKKAESETYENFTSYFYKLDQKDETTYWVIYVKDGGGYWKIKEI